MKKVIKLTESELTNLIKRIIEEGNLEKSVKSKDYDVKLDRFQDTIKNFLKSKDCKVKQVGDDFEVHCDGEHIGQVMFRKTGIKIKAAGDKFGKEFDFTEMGKVKSELSKLLKK